MISTNNLQDEEMDPSVSMSKGVFLFSNGFKRTHKSKKHKKKSVFDIYFGSEEWLITFRHNWNLFEEQLKNLHEKSYSVLLHDVVNYLKICHNDSEMNSIEGVIPSATLLTGVNQPDHVEQFMSLINLIREEVTPHVAMINSQDGSTVKHLVENAVWQLIRGVDLVESDEDICDDIVDTSRKLKKSTCTMKTLRNWYRSRYSNESPRKMRQRQSLIVIIPDFESFNCNTLQDFVMIISSYVSTLPIVLVFGVATSVSALHKSFPYQVSSKLLIKVFHSHPSHVYMNQVLENIFLTHTSPFHLSGKAFELLTDVFLFYDFSVTGFVQSIKYCMMEHYYGDNIKSLCCDRNKLDNAVMKLSADDLESIRQLTSFKPFLEVQDCLTTIALFKDNDFFKEVLIKELHKLHDYIYSFYVCVRLLSVFLKELPKNILGKTVREVYAKCATEHITSTEGFKECMQLLKFQSQAKLVDTIKNAHKVVSSALQMSSPVKPLRLTPMKNNLNNSSLNNELGEAFIKNIRLYLMMFLRQIEDASNEDTTETMNCESDEAYDNVHGNRYKLKEKLLKATRAEKLESKFEMIRSRFVSSMEEIFSKGLQPPHTQTFHEILFFTEVANVKKQIIGSPRGALHMALNNPVHYLKCCCCNLSSPDSLSDKLPDVSLAYKLHRECGKHINLYDWLQAFASVLNPDCDEENRSHDVNIQVRFTRAVAELQFLGFIKTSKRKTDHVMRLTW
ncbi:origin recognition complex subunit 3 isoform X2 [Leptidea sinapis]|uniref:origin recognition complex subunit 3 isoform X1 n=1 Tax=Leptidea sinapis TaxID=189913 RepID=UPI0021313C70|nr:origin recognition complex subunit 3 isoform X1 [Leptidea sinapis]XP_050663610.1 origin recognition complex subunit 3 isoform X2 [Leptidea sinapis]XP_050663611.1 origin recognition complex subunit 3 isoform X3 [Leptidea sinapis]XP_050663612.1 origin recognition complex subunit 3 isoform X3 [Leptidea sinapis]XP_050663613.1 origin recognition complex subunit 3 isoform X2 [Leptidea sinapis]